MALRLARLLAACLLAACLGGACLVGAGCSAAHGPSACPKSARPVGRDSFTPILLPATNAIYVFDGDVAPARAGDDLWRFAFAGSCAAWQPLAPSTATPPPRARYAAVLDDKRNRILYTGGGMRNDTWALDADALTWSELLTVGNAPAPRDGRFAAWDAAGDRLLLLGDVAWALDFGGSDQGSWHPLPGAVPVGNAAGAFAAAVDPTRSLVVMFGGTDFSGAVINGTSAFDIVRQTWHPIATSGDVPTPRTGARMQWDAVDKVLLLFGGSDTSGAENDLYSLALDGNGVNGVWRRIRRAGTQPPARSDFGMVVTGDLLWLFGGLGACGELDDVWTLPLDGGTWTNVLPQTTC